MGRGAEGYPDHVDTPKAILLDLDGTLVDTNYHHALAWFRAFAEHELVMPLWVLHRHMGMGGDQFIASVAGEAVEDRLGDALRAAHARRYEELIDEVQPLEGAHQLLVDLREAGATTVLASSASPGEVTHYLDLLDARALVDAWTDASDVGSTKPQPDLIHAALARVGATSGLMVGDSVFDCQAAGRAGMPSVGLLTGGFSREELMRAGARQVCEHIEELRDALCAAAELGP